MTSTSFDLKSIRLPHARRRAGLGFLDRFLYASLCVNVFLVPLEGAVLLGTATITIFVGAASSLAFLGSVVFERRPIHRSGAAGRSMAIRIALAMLSLSLWSEDPAETSRQLPFLIRLSLLGTMVYQVAVADEARWRGFCKSVGLGAGVAAGIIVSNLIRGVTFFDASGVFVQRTIEEAGVGSARRYTVARVDPNYMAMVLAICLLVFWAGNKSGRRLAYFVTPLILFAMALTGSRTAIVACFAAGAYYVVQTFFRGNQRWRLFVGTLACLAVVAVAWQFVPQDTQVRARTVFSAQEDNSATQREKSWTAGIAAWQDVPILGSGLASYLNYVSRYAATPKAAHNLYVNQLVEGGLVGVAVSIYGLSGVWRSTSSSRVRPERIAMVYWAVTGLAVDIDLNKLTFVFLALCLASSQHRSKAELERPSGSASPIAHRMA